MKQAHPTCAVSNCPLPAYSRNLGGYCMPHYQFVRRSDADPATFVPMSVRRGDEILPPAADGVRIDTTIRHTFCRQMCGTTIWARTSVYCRDHALEAKEAGESVDRTGICAVLGCTSRRRTSDKLCSPHFSRAQAFSLSEDGLVALLARGACEICDGKQLLSIDHDHSCCPDSGKSCGACIRGLICMPCNVLLGHIEKDADRIPRALEYLASRKS